MLTDENRDVDANRVGVTLQSRGGRRCPLWLLWLRVHGLVGYLAVCGVVAGCYVWQRAGAGTFPFPLWRDTALLPAVLAVGLGIAVDRGIPFLEYRNIALLLRKFGTVCLYGVVAILVLAVRPGDAFPAVMIRSFLVAAGIALLVLAFFPVSWMAAFVVGRGILLSVSLGVSPISGVGQWLLWESPSAKPVLAAFVAAVLFVVGNIANTVRGGRLSP